MANIQQVHTDDVYTMMANVCKIPTLVDKLEALHRQNIRHLYRNGYTRNEILEIIMPRSMDYKTRIKNLS